MLKVYGVCVATVLLLSASAFATSPLGGIGQSQNFNIIGENMVSMIDGPGSTAAGNMSTISQGQSVIECCKLTGMQNESSMLSQSANACGKCGILGVLQGAMVGGAQEQLANSCSLKGQGQIFNMGLMQSATKTGGEGGASGAQGSVTDQEQSILGGGVMSECQFVGATQYADVSGACGSDSLAANTLGITASQTQMSN